MLLQFGPVQYFCQWSSVWVKRRRTRPCSDDGADIGNSSASPEAMMTTARYALLAYFAAAVLYVGYAWYSYSGLYRLAAELQMQMFGAYSLKMTFLAPLVVLMIPGAVIERVFGLRRKPGARTAAASSASAASSSPPIGMALVAVVLLVVATGAGWLGYQKSVETQQFESVDLSRDGKPTSTHVVMTGVARTEYILKFETTVGGTTTTDNYIPLTAANWRRGEPLVYFLKTNATVYFPSEGGKYSEYAQATPPFQMTTQPAALVRNALPGPIAAIYRKHNIAVAAAPTVLDLNPGADAEPYLVTMGIAGLVGFCCMMAAVMMALKRRRVPQI
jgi:hypothetical protein